MFACERPIDLLGIICSSQLPLLSQFSIVLSSRTTVTISQPRSGDKTITMSLFFNLPNPPASPPLLSTGFAVGASTLFTFTYVASLYLAPAGRLIAGKQDAQGNAMDRDHPVVIRSRIKTATVSTALIVAATGLGLWVKGVIPRAVSCGSPSISQERSRALC